MQTILASGVATAAGQEEAGAQAPRVHSLADVRDALGFWMRLDPPRRKGGPTSARELSKESSVMAGVLGKMYHFRADFVQDDYLQPEERTALYAGLVFYRMEKAAKLPLLAFSAQAART